MHRLDSARRHPLPLLPYFLSPAGLSTALVAVLGAFSLSACGPSGTPGGPPGGYPPAPVSVMTVAPADVPVEFEYVAQTAGSREVEIRARVAGILLKRNYVEGANVKAGQSLFTLDTAPYLATAARAEADMVSAEARLAQSQRQAVRLKPLIEAKAVSQKDYDDATSGEQVANADLKAARARLTEARLNLSYARVESPLNGVASRSLKSEGALISGPEVLLTTVTQVNPMFVNFGLPDADQLKLKRDIEAGQIRLPNDGRFDVQVKLSDGSVYAKTGKLDFSDVRINPATGTSDARAELPNPDQALRPGQFVRVRLLGATRANAVRVPQRAVLEGPAGKFVYVVVPGDKNNNSGGAGEQLRADMRVIDAGEWSGDSWVVRSGLKAGDRVITDGVMKIGPGAPVSLAPAVPPSGPLPGSQPAAPGAAPGKAPEGKGADPASGAGKSAADASPAKPPEKK
jgi:membrane fusion protein, multidrug efflux system